jgi:hypothetical protein
MAPPTPTERYVNVGFKRQIAACLMALNEQHCAAAASNGSSHVVWPASIDVRTAGLSMAAPVPQPHPSMRSRRRQLERWQRQRQFVVLLAEDTATGQLLGTATLSLTRCEAALPPPFPTSKLLRSGCCRSFHLSLNFRGASICLSVSTLTFLCGPAAP